MYADGILLGLMTDCFSSLLQECTDQQFRHYGHSDPQFERLINTSQVLGYGYIIASMVVWEVVGEISRTSPFLGIGFLCDTTLVSVSTYFVFDERISVCFGKVDTGQVFITRTPVTH